jgi:hypothetical protein
MCAMRGLQLGGYFMHRHAPLHVPLVVRDAGH